MNLLPSAVAAIVLCVAPKALPADDAPAEKGLSNPFFALCISTHDARYRTPADQAKLLKELGYDGMAHVWLAGVDEAIKAADDNGLKLFQVYVRASLDPQKPAYDPRLKQVIESLKGRRTSLGLLIQGKPPSTVEHDGRAVEIVREIADMAAASGINVALYPHTGDWLERVEDAVRVAKKTDRKNVGVTFNLCHWLAVDDKEDPLPVLRLAAPYLFAVTINGSERHITRSQRKGWIQTLDRGSFDNGKLLAVLKELGYTGPVGLQCYAIRGDVRENLQHSMRAWRELSARLAAEEK